MATCESLGHIIQCNLPQNFKISSEFLCTPGLIEQRVSFELCIYVVEVWVCTLVGVVQVFVCSFRFHLVGSFPLGVVSFIACIAMQSCVFWMQSKKMANDLQVVGEVQSLEKVDKGVLCICQRVEQQGFESKNTDHLQPHDHNENIIEMFGE